MLEGQVEKAELDRLPARCVARSERVTGEVARHRIGGKGARLAPEHVAGKLVEQQDQRQTAAPVGAPARELPGCRALVIGQEVPAQRFVELGTALEPHLAPLAKGGPARRAEPEAVDLHRAVARTLDHAESP